MSTSTGKRKYTVRVDNVYFLSRKGLSLRWAMRGIAHQDLPVDIRQLLARLDEIEAQDAAAHSDARQVAPDDAKV